MATVLGSKGNPASHRMGNSKLKSRRAKSWADGQARKLARQKLQNKRAEINRQRVALGERTTWQEAKFIARQRKLGILVNETTAPVGRFLDHAERSTKCQCEHADHFDGMHHKYLSVEAGTKKVAFVGAVCDPCFRKHAYGAVA